MRRILAAATIVTLLAGGIRLVGATVQWWTPEEKDCPTFDTQANCVGLVHAGPRPVRWLDFVHKQLGPGAAALLSRR